MPLLRVRVGAGETLVYGEDGGLVASHRHRGLTATVNERLWRLDRLRRRRPTLTTLDPVTGEVAPVTGAVEYAVRVLGLAVGEEFFGGAVGEALTGGGERLDVGVEVEDAELAGVPWEVVVLPGEEEPLALVPGARMYRVRRGAVRRGTPQAGGVLRILAAFAGPDGDERLPLLDVDADVLRVLGALRPGVDAGRIVVDVVDGGDTLGEMGRHLRARLYDIVHLSCHARAGALLLEDALGAVDMVTSERLAGALGEEAAPVVVLAGCSTGAETHEPGSFARARALTGMAAALVDAGVPAVLAMTAPVSDGYASRFCAEMYQDMAGSGADVLQAVSDARRRLRQRPGPSDLSEWPTPALFVNGSAPQAQVPPGTQDTAGLFVNGSAPQAQVPPGTQDTAGLFADRSPPRPGTQDTAAKETVPPHVVRRAVLRDLARLWRGVGAGLMVYGIGGSGTTVVVNDLVERLGRAVVLAPGDGGADGVLRALAGLLTGPAAARVRDQASPWRERLVAFRAAWRDDETVILVVETALHRMTARSDGTTPPDGGLADLLAAWIQGPPAFRLILTGRHPVTLPGAAHERLAPYHLGPLSPGEARLLATRLPGLGRVPAWAVDRVLERIGGHPVALGYVDALLRGDRPWHPDLRERLDRTLAALGRTLGEAREHGLNAAIRMAADLVTHETGAARLLADLTEEDAEALSALAVFRRPAADDEHGTCAGAVARLDAAGLLAPVPGAGRLVHRWLAGALPASREAHARAADHWLRLERDAGDEWRVVEDLAEARYHFRQAGRTGDAAMVTAGLCDRLQTTGAFARAERIARDTLAWQDLDGHNRAIFMYGTGVIAQDTGRPAEARGLLEEAVRLFGEAGERIDAASAELQLGILDEHIGDYPAAIARYERGLAEFTAAGDMAEVARARHHLGNVHVLMGDNVTARGHYEATLAIEEELGERERIAGTLHQLGVVEHGLGEPEKAAGHYRRAIELATEAGYRTGVSSGHHQLGMLAYEQGELKEATDHCRRAMRIDDEAGDLPNVARGEHLLGMIAHEAEDLGQAEAHYNRALALLTAAGDRAAAGTVHHQLGMLASTRGDLPRAWEEYRRALAVAEEVGDRDGIARAYHEFGMLHVEENRLIEARDWYDRAKEIFEELEDRGGLARVHCALGRLEHLHGRSEGAVAPTLRGFALAIETDDQVAVPALRQLAELDRVLGRRRFRKILERLTEPSAVPVVLRAVDAAHEP
ncbi:tetratricopeptide repeat protein [Sphaerisporangium sp. B11E5]|uniref:tetratricopeptide repeat protein n=1 Tax=Sphaerisporangium sp. B11E5 TaxID=3153563 RepID=UPI00325CE7ED